MPRKIEKIAWIIFFMMIIILFVSSSMTYKQQTIVPLLNEKVPQKPVDSVLNNVQVTYGGIDESIQGVGYSGLIEFIIRKIAHFGSYFILGASLWIASYRYVNKKNLLFMFTWLTTTGLAAFDEFHQWFAAGRSPLVSDVMLDSCGALVGILLTMLLFKLIFKQKKLVNNSSSLI
ncbi:membrane protein [Companilactobacillus sp. RD055328]|uniref:VanZ family protein n=1 Tax=Companilactobacillus sp. RD055328 TaxID=2916634 RepID=UPI001FC81714|nr:VanZ family protein [Companilactobacillus sp. RD055328]GKQ42996.1 membrane protein [Companilactobacillus sp. RD055328]